MCKVNKFFFVFLLIIITLSFQISAMKVDKKSPTQERRQRRLEKIRECKEMFCKLLRSPFFKNLFVWLAKGDNLAKKFFEDDKELQKIWMADTASDYIKFMYLIKSIGDGECFLDDIAENQNGIIEKIAEILKDFFETYDGLMLRNNEKV